VTDYSGIPFRMRQPSDCNKGTGFSSTVEVWQMCFNNDRTHWSSVRDQPHGRQRRPDAFEFPSTSWSGTMTGFSVTGPMPITNEGAVVAQGTPLVSGT
jgi:hypothetical protein